VLLLPPVSREPPLWLKSHLRLLLVHRGRALLKLLVSRMLLLLLQISKLLARRVLPPLLASRMLRLLLRISKPLAKQVLLLLEASRATLLLLQGSKRLVRKVLLWLKSHLRLLLHRVKHLLQLGRKVPILLPVLCKGLLLQLARQVRPRLA